MMAPPREESCIPDLRSSLTAAAERVLAVAGRWAASPWAPSALIALGIALRVRRWLANIGLKVGESELALNLVSRGYADLLRPLDHDQGAPIGFLWLARLALETFRNDERALRGVAMVAGVASLPLFWALARRALPRSAALLSLGLFAFAPKLIAHAAEVKQYSSDVAITLALTLAAFACLRAERAGARLVVLAAVGALAPWFSHAAALVLAGLGAGLAGIALAQRDVRRVAGLAGVGLSWVASLAALWWISLRQLTRNEFLLTYWSRGFMPLPPRSLADLRWFPEMAIRTFEDPGYFMPAAFAAFAFVVGVVVWLRSDPVRAGLVLAPMGVTLLASGVHQYPFMDRLISFLLPCFLLAAGAGLEGLRALLGRRGSWVWALFAGWMLLDAVSSESLRFFAPRHDEDSREIVATLAGAWREGDAVYLYWDSQYPFAYYAPRLGFAPPDVKVGRSAEGRWDDAMADVQELPRRDRVWLMFSHVHQAGERTSEESFFLLLLERAGGRPLARYEEVGASLHLFDLSGMRQGAWGPW
jgi:hypothetical protein